MHTDAKCTPWKSIGHQRSNRPAKPWNNATKGAFAFEDDAGAEDDEDCQLDDGLKLNDPPLPPPPALSPSHSPESNPGLF